MNLLTKILKGTLIGLTTAVGLVFLSSVFPLIGLIATVGAAAYGVYRVSQAVGIAALKAARYMGMDVEVPAQRPRLRDRLGKEVQNRVQKGYEWLREQPDLRQSPYSQDTGWDLNKIPSGLKPELVSNKDRRVIFSCCGQKSNVIAESDRFGRVKYSFTLPVMDAKKFKEFEAVVKSLPVASIKDLPGSDRKLVTARTPDAILTLANIAFPSKVEEKAADVSESVKEETHDVIRQYTKVEQYLVTGCTSEAVAMQKVRAGLAGNPVNVYSKTVDEVDGNGKIRIYYSGSPYELSDSLPFGTFLIDKKTLDSYHGKLQVPAGLTEKDKLLDIVKGKYVPSAKERIDGTSVPVIEGCPIIVNRYVSDKEGNRMDLLKATPDSLKKSGLMANLVFSSQSEFVSFLKGGKLTEGTQVVFQEGRMDTPKEGFVFSMEPSMELMNMFAKSSVREHLSPELQKNCELAGLSSADIVFSTLCSKCAEQPVTLTLNDSIAFNPDLLDSWRSQVNGIAAREFEERLENPRLDTLSDEEARKWAEDAGRIESVTITVNPETKTVTICSVIDGVVKAPQVRPLTDKELQAFTARGEISTAEKKDLLMQGYPQIFETYRFGSKSRYEDPVSDFLTGQRLMYTAAYQNHLDRKLGLGQKNNQVKKNSPKLGYGGLPI